ncbi:kinase-like protein [Heliocybe sulcata]|uniref:Kinase-like protein n=1 Tax=Heliocybe sulcata TaxID=5364 RepID=A0A5C3NAE0_9AGAM|nr:kinase-like protein [Heliocybe sulcata]
MSGQHHSSHRKPLPVPGPDECPNLSKDITNINELVADGGFSKVYRGTWRVSGAKKFDIVIKYLRFNTSDEEWQKSMRKSALREINVWCKLQDDNILKLHGFCDGLGPGMAQEMAPALVSSFCKNGTVMHYLGKQTGDALQAAKSMATIGITYGLQYLHRNGIVHGDLKPNNVLVSDGGQPLITDFGRSKILDKEGFTHTIAAISTRYTAPEVLVPEGDNEIPVVTKSSDVYSFAMTILEFTVCFHYPFTYFFKVYTGNVPFAGIKLDTKVIVVVAAHAKRPPLDGVPPDWHGLLQKCWDKDSIARPSMAFSKSYGSTSASAACCADSST